MFYLNIVPSQKQYHQSMKAKTTSVLLVTIVFSLSSIASNVSDSTNVYKPKRYTNFIFGTGHLALNSSGAGIKYCGSLRLKKNERFGIGPSIFYESVQFSSNVKFPADVTEVKMSFTTPGLNIQYTINKILSFQIGLSALLGKQEITRVFYVNTNSNPFGIPVWELRQKNEEHYISGVQIEQNLLFKKEQKTGISFGLGLFERIVNANFYETDFGLKAYLGFYF